jgi:uncharacterized protein (TIGR00299 family) protein
MGAAGDMLTGALLELTDAPEDFIQALNQLGLPGVSVQKQPAFKRGIVGTRVKVLVNGCAEESADAEYGHEHGHGHEHEHGHAEGGGGSGHGHEHEHGHEHGHGSARPPAHSHGSRGGGSSLGDIQEILYGLPLKEKVREHALGVYQLLAEAEAHVHGCPTTDIHFHEVGTLDALTDILGVCLLMDAIAPQRVIVSPIHVGKGFVRCAHGILPVPAPAVAHLLKGAPMYARDVEGELCTPTGAAILKYFGDEYGPIPDMTVERIGYGMGTKDFGTANCVRVFLGEASFKKGTNMPRDEIVKLECNLDDMTGEAVGYAVQILLEAGANDVFTVPVQMKKNRPGTLLTCLCAPEAADGMAALMLKHTTTFGVRKTLCPRYILDRKVSLVQTEFGGVRIKTGYGYGVLKFKPEYEDAAQAAKSHGVSFNEVCARAAGVTRQSAEPGGRAD